MKHCLFRRYYVPVFLFALLLAPCGLNAQAPPYEAALQALQAGRVQDALDLMQQAVVEYPQNLEYQYSLGGIYMRLDRFDEAEAIFQALLRENPEQYRKVYFDLAAIYQKRGKDQEALNALREARLVDEGRADYESGIIYMRLKNYVRAIELFKNARAVKPELAPEAMTQQAIALFQLKRFDESKKLLQAVSAMHLPAARAEEIKRLMGAIDGAEKAQRPWHFSAITGFQYDSNILQNPLNSAAGVTNAEDGAELTSLTFRYDAYREPPWRLGFSYNHYNLLYFDHDDVSLIGARPSLYAFWEEKPFIAGIEYMYSHYWSAESSVADVNSFFPVFAYTYNDRWRTEVRGNGEIRDYLNNTPSDRLLGISVIEYYLMDHGKAHLRAGYRFEQDEMETDDPSFHTNEAMIGLQVPIYKDKWFFDIAGYFVERDYDFDPALGKNRHDSEQDLNVMLRGPVAPNLQLILLFQRTWNDSNINFGAPVFDPFNYRRAIFTCMLSYDY